MQGGAYFEFLCWDLRTPLSWGEGIPLVQSLEPNDRSKVEAALALIKSMTERSFNEGGDNASYENLAMTMETRVGAPYFGGPERSWSDLCAGFSAISMMKKTHVDILKAIGFLTEIEIPGGYFEVRKHLDGQYPIGNKVLREYLRKLS
jgi:hypothetical protein